MQRKLFCQLSPAAYKISVKKERLLRRLRDILSGKRFAAKKGEPLPVLLYAHNSLIRRKLGNVDMLLQENKAENLQIAAPKVTGILIRPGETFSFWRLVGCATRQKGYKEGLTISLGAPGRGMGGGMCQFTNLLHWMVLHSPLTVTELHHHNQLDMFPDFGRQVPFGCGTSIFYNYIDYRCQNNTANTFQFLVRTTATHLCGELRALHTEGQSYHITEEDAHFAKENGQYYRRNRIYRRVVDKASGRELAKELLTQSNARVLYGREFIKAELLRSEWEQ